MTTFLVVFRKNTGKQCRKKSIEQRLKIQTIKKSQQRRELREQNSL